MISIHCYNFIFIFLFFFYFFKHRASLLRFERKNVLHLIFIRFRKTVIPAKIASYIVTISCVRRWVAVGGAADVQYQ